MIICKTKLELRQNLKKWRRKGERVGAVPTMGALHQGHLSLIAAAKEKSDRTVATIFVNPLQFGPNEDFETYPRDMERDFEMLEASGCDLVFAPEHADLFAPDFSTRISVAGVGEGHCAQTRPQFFDGVATIVTKLLMNLSPDVAVFGEKDYQQLTVIKRLVRDLDIPVEIIGAPIIREEDGLAMSSRNQYLTPSERAAAPVLYETINLAADKFIGAGSGWSKIHDWAAARILKAGFSKVDYLNMVDVDTLEPMDKLDRPARLLAAAWIGRTRLIDNIAVTGPGSA